MSDHESMGLLTERDEYRRVLQVAKQTRMAQDRYFKTRDPADLREAKRLERELDSMLAKLSTVTPPPKQAPVQGSLFNNTPDASKE
jgi:hypothetical protein